MNSSSFIKELLIQKGSTQIEYLSQFDIEQILKIICSFLNSEGGWVVVGFKEKELVGVSNLSDDDIVELKNDINERISPQPLVYVQKDIYEERNVILINVLKGSRQPYSLDKEYYVRSRNLFKVANPDDLSLLLRSSNVYTSTWEKLTTIDAAFVDLDETEVARTILDSKKIGKGNVLPENPQEFLSYFQLFDYTAIKNGAIILFGNTPSKFLAQCKIRITIMPEGKTGDHYEELIIEDNLFVALNRVQEYFKRNQPTISKFQNDNWDRINREKYPFDALDEAIVNAMVHRDYGDMSGEITVNIYPNKIEITNSGVIPPDIIKGKSTIKAHHSVLRNPTIAHMFYLRGKMEKLGRGLSLIINRFIDFGLKLPEWSTQSGYTTLTLHGIPNQIEITDRMIKFLNQLKSDEFFTREQYEDFFKGEIKERTARTDLEKLIKGKWLAKIGDGPQTKYSKTNKKLPDITG